MPLITNMQAVANNPMVDRSTVASALAKATAALLAARNEQGLWTGELSSSALSTATAVAALAIFNQYSEAVHDDDARLVYGGLKWLAEHANADGGWGDTIRSVSNLSTTALCWAAFGADAILEFYGKDKTFSVPILTMCALSGRLGHVSVAFRSVVPLPFELAALPRSWFGALRLPVVSYALPALIAIGQVRHHYCPSGNPLRRFLRNATRKRTLKVLGRIQPSNGGFLEATPLTSFVAMSLAASDQAEHIVTRRAIDFIRAGARADGSWPIDTDLGTWVSTLAVNALSETANAETEGNPLMPEDRHRVQRLLTNEQQKERHPYTDAAAGGWAWTDKPGGVPDADDTAGALVAVRNLEWAPEQRFSEGIRDGLVWLLNLQNSDGGIPTFCRGICRSIGAAPI